MHMHLRILKRQASSLLWGDLPPHLPSSYLGNTFSFDGDSTRKEHGNWGKLHDAGVGDCQNDGPFWVPIIIRGRIRGLI